VQIGTPDEILRNPCDEYVRAFFKGVDVNKYLVAKDVASPTETLVIQATSDANSDMHAAIACLRETQRMYAFVVDANARFQGTVSMDSMHRALDAQTNQISDAFLSHIQPVSEAMALRNLIGQLIKNPVPLPVVDAQQRYLGVVTQTILLKKMVQEERGNHE
jgi:glycine betaine/proline transport system ATP-binding protein